MNYLKFAVAVSALVCLVQPDPAQAQAWPSKPLQMVVPQGAGGSTDAIARLVGQALGERLGQTVVIDNRAGAGGVLGVAAAAKAAPDGHTLLIGSNTTVAANAILYASFPVDPLKAFMPLALAADAPFVFVVPAASPLKSVRDLVSAAKATPGKLTYGSGTSSALLCTELFKAAAGVDLLKVPYKSSAQGLTDLIGGQIDVVCEPLSASLPNIKAGRLRALAQTGAQRSALAPDLDTVVEAGVPGMAYSAWVGFFAPAGSPPDAVAKLRSELHAILMESTIQERIRSIGFEPRPGNADALAALHRAELKSVAATVKAAGIQAQ